VATGDNSVQSALERQRTRVPRRLQGRYSIVMLGFGLVWFLVVWLVTNDVTVTIRSLVIPTLFLLWDVYRFNRPRSPR
jgi:Flp pilus assembly protein TadB